MKKSKSSKKAVVLSVSLLLLLSCAFAGESADVFERPGVKADRKTKTVTVKARSTQLEPSGNPPEFLLVAPNSGHDYEAVAVSEASAGDISEALLFIGMPQGAAYDPLKLRFWPKGERAKIVFEWQGTNGAVRRVNSFELLKDTRTGKTLPDNGWVFSSDRRSETNDGPKTAKWEADEKGPNSIISTYNEKATVFDVPRKVQQGEEYGYIVVNPEYVIPSNSVLRVIITPELTNGTRRVVDISLAIKASPTDGAPLFDLSGGTVANLTNATIDKVLKTFSDLNEAGKDPFVSISFDDSISLDAARSVCRVIEAIETEKGIRAEPPPEGQLFYRAFLPDERNRDKSNRLAQPWELRFARDDGKISAKLVKVNEIWPEDAIKPTLTAEEIPIQTPAELSKVLNDKGPAGGIHVILSYAPGYMKYGEIMAFLRPVLPLYKTIFVFIEK